MIDEVACLAVLLCLPVSLRKVQQQCFVKYGSGKYSGCIWYLLEKGLAEKSAAYHARHAELVLGHGRRSTAMWRGRATVQCFFQDVCAMALVSTAEGEMWIKRNIYVAAFSTEAKSIVAFTRAASPKVPIFLQVDLAAFICVYSTSSSYRYSSV